MRAFLAFALLLGSCAGSRSAADERVVDGATPSTTRSSIVGLPAELTPAQVAQLPRAVQRQYRKNLRAQPRTVPLVQGRAAVAVAGDVAAPVQTSYKPEAAQVLATDSATVATAQSRKGPAVAAGQDAEVPIITTAVSWVRPLLPYAAGALGLGQLYSLVPLPLAGAGWLWLLLRGGKIRTRRNNRFP